MSEILLFDCVLKYLQDIKIIGEEIASGSRKDERSLWYTVSYFYYSGKGIFVFDVIIENGQHYIRANTLKILARFNKFKISDIVKQCSPKTATPSSPSKTPSHRVQ
ncbi:hypothetical protein [Treponema phagedenis]|uniref:Uncharacterized protein n=1 Tax=Treponema phagedenis TaxID=162 RepID=A0AAE6IVH2_TREPH|nr:hypothetical protein [Treponema phagedenis]NVP22733.1 hypothetical protein [Treponema phagedenis]QEJ95316.1 hypothetical protein FUT79_08950 [Treponema phagedenis]QEJ96966.1 hypothetical protein FUT82_02525 [Treponema phagedenis]QEJ97977.1 hypothetical protein FUT82_08180 [Treponema phagedenis]QKS92549.1 hypothetical protein HPJ96_08330 [Treponema phagedenis]